MGCGARLPPIADTVLGWAMLAAWVFGVGYITFGDDREAPARNIGNLYFATWASFLITCLLASSGLRAMFVGGDDAETTTEEAKPREAFDEENVEPREEADEVKAAAEDVPEDEAVVAADTGDVKKK
jgi:hypothetical protein